MNGVPVAEVVRSGFVEGRHHGSVVAVDPDGETAWSLGDPDATVLARSCLKPLQAVAMVRSGLTLDAELLALACSSHSGEPFHIDGVRAVLAGAGLAEDMLRCPPDLPLDDTAARALVREGGAASRVAMNCSGKHAAMLATCVANEWELSTYLETVHPLQQAVRATIQELTGVSVQVTAVDGCGLPLLSNNLVGLARAFSRVARADEEPESRVAAAIRTHPEWVSGTRRDERDLLVAVPGAIAKAGAEGCYAVALPDGRAVALKIEDGSSRARRAVMAAALRRSGVADVSGVDLAALDATGHVVVLGGGRPVGVVRALI